MGLSKHIVIAAALSYLLAFFAPVSGGSAAFAAAAMLAASLVLSVALLRSLRRRDALAEWIAIELNKLRRVYHLSKNLGDERYRQWFTELHGFVYGYLTAFDKLAFDRYAETNGHFRKLSYHLYQIPELETEKQRVLYRELLEAAGEAAGARQHIQELWNGGLHPSLWTGLYALTGFAAAAILSATGPADRLAAAASLAVLGTALILTRDADRLASLAGDGLSKRYVENLARLELARKN